MTTTTKQACDCGCNEFHFTKDLNLDFAWKAGNKYCRICTDCGARYFLAKSMYEAVEDQYVIVAGEDDPVPSFDCPACDEPVTGTPNKCPFCDQEYVWGEPDDEAEDDQEAVEPDDEDDEEEVVDAGDLEEVEEPEDEDEDEDEDEGDADEADEAEDDADESDDEDDEVDDE